LITKTPLLSINVRLLIFKLSLNAQHLHAIGTTWSSQQLLQILALIHLPRVKYQLRLNSAETHKIELFVNKMVAFGTAVMLQLPLWIQLLLAQVLWPKFGIKTPADGIAHQLNTANGWDQSSQQAQ
jgi:uncharacterized membrane protein